MLSQDRQGTVGHPRAICIARGDRDTRGHASGVTDIQMTTGH